MKKITTLSLLIFALITGFIFTLGLLPHNNRNFVYNTTGKTPTVETKKQLIQENKGSKNTLRQPAQNHQKGPIYPPKININNIKYKLEQDNRHLFTLLEIAKHNTQNNCYLAINNNVYDVSLYIDLHPGGARIIVSNCGKEVTGVFAKIHSNRAWDLLKNYKIGSINTNKQNTTSKILGAIFKSLQKENPNAEVINIKPKNNFYIAKLVYQGNLYEVHINNLGQIVKEETAGDEPNWSNWNQDSDDK